MMQVHGNLEQNLSALLSAAGCGVWRTRSTGRTCVRHPLMMALPTSGQAGACRAGPGTSVCPAMRPFRA